MICNKEEYDTHYQKELATGVILRRDGSVCTLTISNATVTGGEITGLTLPSDAYPSVETLVMGYVTVSGTRLIGYVDIGTDGSVLFRKIENNAVSGFSGTFYSTATWQV